MLVVESDDIAKRNLKFSKTGKYYPPNVTKLTINKRHWCVECKLYHLEKDMFKKDLCKECKDFLITQGFHFCECGCMLFPECKYELCLICRKEKSMNK